MSAATCEHQLWTLNANGDVLVPGYDVDGKLWTIQYIKEDGTKRFAKDSRKQGCSHVVGAPNGATAIQKIAMSSMVVIAEGYATAVTLAKHGKGPTLAAYDSGNLLSVANAVHQRCPDKAIVIAGDDDHATENSPGREKALAAAEAVFKLVHKFDDPAPGNLLSKKKKTTTLEISLISLLHSFLDFSYYSSEAVEPHQKSPFSG